MHTELGRSQVEVQRCTLSWEAPRLRSRSAHWRNWRRRRRWRRRRTRRRTTALIKSNNPHLAGGEKPNKLACSCKLRCYIYMWKISMASKQSPDTHQVMAAKLCHLLQFQSSESPCLEIVGREHGTVHIE